MSYFLLINFQLLLGYYKILDIMRKIEKYTQKINNI